MVARDIPMKRELKGKRVYPVSTNTLSCTRYPNEEGTESLLTGHDISRGFCCTRYPNEEGTERLSSFKLSKIVQSLHEISQWRGNWKLIIKSIRERDLQVARDIPMKRELKVCLRNHRLRLVSVARDIPMKRELKAAPNNCNVIPLMSCTRYPNEEGTESLKNPSAPLRYFALHEISQWRGNWKTL